MILISCMTAICGIYSSNSFRHSLNQRLQIFLINPCPFINYCPTYILLSLRAGDLIINLSLDKAPNIFNEVDFWGTSGPEK